MGKHDEPTEPEAIPKSIPIDASVDLQLQAGKFLAMMSEGDIFGEMSCMSHYPRSATVRAVEDCTVLEIFDNLLLKAMRQSERFGDLIDQKYKERALRDQLLSIPIFAGLSEDFITKLRDKVKIERFNPGDPIVEQGKDADSFYIVRLGFVKVSQEHFGNEQVVIRYLGRGNYFGEVGLLGRGRRTATCTALDHVDVVRIDAEQFKLMLEGFPGIRKKFEMLAQERLKADEERLETIETTPLNEYLEQGLVQAQSLLVLDLTSCTRCDACVRACADSHEGVTRLIREGLRYDKHLVPTSCRQCRDPVCIPGCPTGAIHRKNSLEIEIDPIRCIGCEICAKQCPYGNINIHHLGKQGTAPESVPTRRLGGVPLTLEQIQVIPIFKGIALPPGYLSRNPEAVVRRHFKKGEMICREGDYDYTAFYIEEGRVEAFLSFQLPPTTEKPVEGLLSKFRTSLTGRPRPQPIRQAAIAKKDKIAITCDLCKGLATGPNCVYACPHGSARRVNPKEYFQIIGTQ